MSDTDSTIDPDPAWLCDCGHYEETGLHCSCCGAEPPWGCDCSLCEPEEEYDSDESDYDYDPGDFDGHD